MLFHRTLAAAAVCLCSFPAVAQEADEKPFRLQTALDLPEWLKLSGSIRPRYETLENQFVAGRTGSDELLGMQSAFKAEIDVSDFAFVGEIVDARRLIGNDGGGAPGEVDALEPVQLFAAWRPKDFLMKGASLDLTVGRFTMDVGSRRLVSRSGFRNILSSFDGVRGAWSGPDGVKVTGFYTAPTSPLAFRRTLGARQRDCLQPQSRRHPLRRLARRSSPASRVYGRSLSPATSTRTTAMSPKPAIGTFQPPASA